MWGGGVWITDVSSQAEAAESELQMELATPGREPRAAPL